MALTRWRISVVTSSIGTPNARDPTKLWRSSPVLNASISCVLGQVCHDAHLDLAVVGGHQTIERRPVLGTTDDEAMTDLAAGSVRTGMFCRFGSVDDSRPVAATV